ncbi:hypothetical protein EVAR_80212_1 [Eumeta japonica]|uniref:GAG-pre-integrase domain-containing protein n=1 Tax=Eumeta variegata TaxID=151549 RepID=A0A4C1UCC2_EUMVA|nr:hypothetical protein EVAR_80212_1 [Eumeta japonica]
MKKGKIVFLKYDKLVVKENKSTKEKRKRETSSSPHSSDLQLKNQQTSMPFKQLTLGKRKTQQNTETKVKITENRKPPPSRLVIVGENDQHPLSANNQSNDKTKCDIHIPSINTRSLRTPEKLIELETEINEIKWDIVGISEMRRQGEGIEDYGNHMLYYKGETPGQYGVGLLIKHNYTHVDQINHRMNMFAKETIVNEVALSEKNSLEAGLPEKFSPMIMAIEHSGIQVTTDAIKSKLLDMETGNGNSSEDLEVSRKWQHKRKQASTTLNEDSASTSNLPKTKLATNLISVSKLIEKGNRVYFNKDGCLIYNRDGDLVATATLLNGVYRLNMQERLIATATTSGHIWHRRLGHVNSDSLMKTKNAVTRMDLVEKIEKSKSRKTCRCEGK